MGLIFEWDNRKAKSNEEKHGISFPEGASVFRDALSLTIADPFHSEIEGRFITVGRSVNDRLLVVVHSERGDNIRIISARLATRQERVNYEEGSEEPGGH
ncbi:MAG: BrnT family toxin [Chloroflexi bacterium]|nr:BrnT family toxin [Chloroflexota bacterium]